MQSKPKSSTLPKNNRLVIYTYLPPKMQLTHLSKLSSSDRSIIENLGKHLQSGRELNIFIPKSVSCWDSLAFISNFECLIIAFGKDDKPSNSIFG